MVIRAAIPAPVLINRPTMEPSRSGRRGDNRMLGDLGGGGGGGGVRIIA